MKTSNERYESKIEVFLITLRYNCIHDNSRLPVVDIAARCKVSSNICAVVREMDIARKSNGNTWIWQNGPINPYICMKVREALQAKAEAYKVSKQEDLPAKPQIDLDVPGIIFFDGPDEGSRDKTETDYLRDILSAVDKFGDRLAAVETKIGI